MPVLHIVPVAVFPNLQPTASRDAGGMPGRCPPPSPRLAGCLRELRRATREAGLESSFDVTLEVTHHGPWLETPASETPVRFVPRATALCAMFIRGAVPFPYNPSYYAMHAEGSFSLYIAASTRGGGAGTGSSPYETTGQVSLIFNFVGCVERLRSREKCFESRQLTTRYSWCGYNAFEFPNGGQLA